MSTVNIDPKIRLRMQPYAFCRNGQIPTGRFQGLLASAANRIARCRPKELFRSGGDVASISASTVWRFGGHVGPMTGSIVVRARMALSNLAPDAAPGLSLTIEDFSGTVLASGSGFYGHAYGSVVNDVPDEWGTATIVVDASTFRDTSVRGTISSIANGRPISCVVYEVPLDADTVYGYLRQQYGVGDPILETDRRDIEEMLVSLYKRGAAPLFTYSSRTDATAASSSSASYAPLVPFLDAAGNPVASGYAPSLQGCNRRMSATVPCRIDCRAAVLAGGSGNVRVIDEFGNAVAAFFIINTIPNWQFTTANLPSDHRKYSVDHRGDGVNAVTTYAVSVYQYTT